MPNSVACNCPFVWMERKSRSDSAIYAEETTCGKNITQHMESTYPRRMEGGKMQTAISTASSSTQETIAKKKSTIATSSNTGVPYVVEKTTPLAIAHPTPPTPPQTELPSFRTRLKADVWEEFLREAGCLEEFCDIPEGIRNSFKVSLKQYELTKTFIPNNNYTLPHHTEHIQNKRDEEIQLR